MIRNIYLVTKVVCICMAFALPCMAGVLVVVEVELTTKEAEEVRNATRQEILREIQFKDQANDRVLLKVPAGSVISLNIDVWREYRKITAADTRDQRRSALRSATRKIDEAKSNAGIEDAEHPEMLEMFREIGMEEQRRNLLTIIVEGEVIGEDGEPLEGVTVTAYKRVLGDVGEWGYETKSVKFAEKVIDGKFRLQADESRSVSLRFEKVGHHPNELSVNPSASPHRSRIMREGLLHSEDNRVLMQPIGMPDDLTQYGAALHFYADGSGEVIHFDMIDESRIRPRPYEFTVKMEDVRNLDAVAQEIPHGVSFVAATTPDGLIAMPENGLRAASEFVLRMHDLKGGFIPYTSTDRLEDDPRISRSMREAPKEGYQREWTVQYEYAPAIFHYFYFKSNGYYGKGRVTYGIVPRDQSHARIGTRFMLQRNEDARGVVTE